MKVFHCQSCQQTVFFENTHCTACNSTLAFVPDVSEMVALPAAAGDTWQPLNSGQDGPCYRLCANYSTHNVCNWALDANDANALCQSCRLTRVIPNLDVHGSREAWAKMEAAKRRLLYTLIQLRLPFPSQEQQPETGLAFDFLSEKLEPSGKVLTGHENGLITINLAEANDVEREKRRLKLNEPYRTLLGHFRHEVGHYYWDRLIQDGNRVEAFRAVFGDESLDYADALKAHYANSSNDWAATYVSAYASSHPWEDWAETWAHYLHMIDALETAAACGVNLRPKRSDEPAMDAATSLEVVLSTNFDRTTEDWLALTYVLNNFSRGLGQADSYPFVLSTIAITKLRFVHEVIGEAAAAAKAH